MKVEAKKEIGGISMGVVSIKNIIKVRDDRAPLELIQKTTDSEFNIADEQQFPSWLSQKAEKDIKTSDLRAGIEPWLTSLFQSDHLSLLVGTGLSIAVEHIAVETTSVQSHTDSGIKI